MGEMDWLIQVLGRFECNLSYIAKLRMDGFYQLLGILFGVVGLGLIVWNIFLKFYIKKKSYKLYQFFNKLAIKYIVGMLIGGMCATGTLYGLQIFFQMKAKRYYEKVKKNPQVFIYDLYHGRVESGICLLVFKKKDKDIEEFKRWRKKIDSLKAIDKLYRKEIDTLYEDDKTIIDTFLISNFNYPPVDFTLGVCCLNPCGYLVSYVDKDNLIAKVVDFDTKCWGYEEFYVYKKTIHFQPPPDSLIPEYLKSSSESVNSPSNNLYGNEPSRYGFYCN